MSKFGLILSAIFLASLLTACANTGMKDGTMVKCPACGHEFSLDSADTGR
jgi:major membrane immunogen (membrane-anchored lipoprotein)